MSIQSEINRLNNNVKNSYGELSKMGLTVPSPQNSDHLPQAIANVSGIIDEKIITHDNSEQSHGDIRDELKQKASLQQVYNKETICSLYSEVPVTMAGTAVSTDMVSPVEHDVGCRVESKNLIPSTTSDSTDVFTVNSDGTVTATRLATSQLSDFRYLNFKSASIFSGEVTFSGIPKNCKCNLALKKNGITLYDAIFGSEPQVINIPDGCDAIFLLFRIPENVAVDHVLFKPMLNYGTSALSYNPYIPDLSVVTVTQNPGGKTFKPSVDGTVTGMKSIAPSMTILTDNPGVTIKATYNADIKKYVEENGALTSNQVKSAEQLKQDRQQDFLNETVVNMVPVTEQGAVVSTDMVSPVEHEVECKIHRINLFKVIKGKIPKQSDGTLTYSTGDTCEFIPVDPLCDYIYSNENTDSAKFLFAYDSEKNYLGYSVSAKASLLFKKYPKTAYIRTRDYTAANEHMFNKGSVALPYTPYISNLTAVTVTQNPGGKTFKPSPDGTVTGMKSISPSMTILTDSPGTLIITTYGTDIVKYKQRNGQLSKDLTKKSMDFFNNHVVHNSTKQYVIENTIPKTEGVDGQFALSDGKGGIRFETFVNRAEVGL